LVSGPDLARSTRRDIDEGRDRRSRGARCTKHGRTGMDWVHIILGSASRSRQDGGPGVGRKPVSFSSSASRAKDAESKLVRYRREHGTSGENSVHDEKRQARILVVEDEVKVARALQEGLERQRYDVVIAPTGEEGFFLVNAEEFSLVILDLMLPGRDGLQVLSTLRKRGLHTPVLILTARDAIEDRVQGLDKGADDYLVKPFAFPELLARVRALLRRTEHVVQLRLADLEMDVVTRKARRRGQYLDLTAREFELLEYLFRHKEQIVSREMLARSIWKESARATPLDNVMDVHINRLRRKVDEPFDRKLIHTVRGVGFVLREEE
jgi:DNA-binding response OmpR family regulator